jgi:hypothetical protein
MKISKPLIVAITTLGFAAQANAGDRDQHGFQEIGCGQAKLDSHGEFHFRGTVKGKDRDFVVSVSSEAEGLSQVAEESPDGSVTIWEDDGGDRALSASEGCKKIDKAPSQEHPRARANSKHRGKISRNQVHTVAKL